MWVHLAVPQTPTFAVATALGVYNGVPCLYFLGLDNFKPSIFLSCFLLRKLEKHKDTLCLKGFFMAHRHP